MKLWLSLFSSCLIIFVVLHGIAYADIIQVGTEAPDFTLSSTKGKSFTLSA